MSESGQPREKKRGFAALKDILSGKEGAGVLIVSYVSILLAIVQLVYMARDSDVSNAATRASQDGATQAKIANQLTLMKYCLDDNGLSQYLTAKYGSTTSNSVTENKTVTLTHTSGQSESARMTPTAQPESLQPRAQLNSTGSYPWRSHRSFSVEARLCPTLLSSANLKAIFSQFTALPVEPLPPWTYKPVEKQLAGDKVMHAFGVVWTHIFPDSLLGALWLIVAVCWNIVFLLVYASVIGGLVAAFVFAATCLFKLILNKIKDTRRGRDILNTTRDLFDRIELARTRDRTNVYPST